MELNKKGGKVMIFRRVVIQDEDGAMKEISELFTVTNAVMKKVKITAWASVEVKIGSVRDKIRISEEVCLDDTFLDLSSYDDNYHVEIKSKIIKKLAEKNGIKDMRPIIPTSVEYGYMPITLIFKKNKKVYFKHGTNLYLIDSESRLSKSLVNKEIQRSERKEMIEKIDKELTDKYKI